MIFFLMLITNFALSQNVDSISINLKDLKFSKKAVNFSVLGDWGRDGKFNQKEVGYAMGMANEMANASFVATVGDNFYENGVESTTDKQWKTSFEDIYTNKGTQITWYATLGNHDYKGNPQAQIDYSKVSNRWQMPSRYYSIEKEISKGKKVLFVFLDTNPFEDKYFGKNSSFSDLKEQNKQQQIDWLENTLKNSDAKWKIVFGHHPFYSFGVRSENENSVKEQLEPIFTKYKVDDYIAGHEHHLQYTNKNGVYHFISGGGSQLRPVDKKSSNDEFSISRNGFMLFSVAKRYFYVNIVDYKGNVLYSKKIKKQN